VLSDGLGRIRTDNELKGTYRRPIRLTDLPQAALRISFLKNCSKSHKCIDGATHFI